eukprot:6809079-Prymnesium_polylepis.1
MTPLEDLSLPLLSLSIGLHPARRTRPRAAGATPALCAHPRASTTATHAPASPIPTPVIILPAVVVPPRPVAAAIAVRPAAAMIIIAPVAVAVTVTVVAP